MWPWIKRWRDWVMNDLWPLSRIGPQQQALHFSYEKAGLTLHDQPIPWNAESVLVEALLRLPPSASRRKGDFKLCVPGQEPLLPEQLRRQETEERFRISFRLQPPCSTVLAELRYPRSPSGPGQLAAAEPEKISSRRCGCKCRRCTSRSATKRSPARPLCRPSARVWWPAPLLVSPTSLVPLLDLDLQVEFRNERDGSISRVPASLSSSQMAGRQALVTVVPRRHPRRQGTWTATWLLGDRPLASQRIRGISPRHFQRSLRISDTRFVVQTGKDPVKLTRQVPSLDKSERIGPCFLVSSSEPGMAGLCRVQINAQVPGAVQPPLLLQQEVLITDGPTMVAPGTLDAADLHQVSGFELQVQGQVLGLLSLCPAPTAVFTSEGGFKPPHDFTCRPRLKRK